MRIDGLLGKKLSHSFSPAVHRALGNPRYRLFETDNLDVFLKKTAFSALNVTIPYKEEILRFLDQKDDSVLRANAANLIVRTASGLIGYNTDYAGMSMMFQRDGVSLQGKSVFIFGNGGAAKTVAALAKNSGCAHLSIAARHPKDGELPMDGLSGPLGHEILINATPVGMFPENSGILPIDPAIFPQAVRYYDLIYNPLNTRSMQAFRSRGVMVQNGLFLLVAQAALSQEIVTGIKVSEETLFRVYQKTAFRAANVVLIGLPLSGKSSLAPALASRLEKIPVDTDSMIESELRMPITEIFRIHGEPWFRESEAEVVDRLYRSGNQVIATGGGMIENDRIMEKLHQNGFVVFLDKNPVEIAKLRAENRPLIPSPEAVLNLAERRRSLYLRHADWIIDPDRPEEEVITEIEAKLYEHFSH
ncbi:MAG TPA: shikimate kinase [Bacillota bacterium]|nr:shikimate kinase [Bacillota bacterium]